MTDAEAIKLLSGVKEFLEFCGGEKCQKEAEAIQYAIDRMCRGGEVSLYLSEDEVIRAYNHVMAKRELKSPVDIESKSATI